MKPLEWVGQNGWVGKVLLFSSYPVNGAKGNLIRVQSTLPGVAPFYVVNEAEMKEKSQNVLENFVSALSE